MDNSENEETAPFNQQFCDTLEWHLSNAFANSADVALDSFWCDGVVTFNESRLSKKAVNDTRQIAAKAYAGNSGQDEYKLILNLGRKSLSRYARDLSLEECLPAAETPDWLMVDVEKKEIYVQML